MSYERLIVLIALVGVALSAIATLSRLNDPARMLARYSVSQRPDQTILQTRSFARATS